MEQNGEGRESASQCAWDSRRRCGGYNSQTQKNERLKIVFDTNVLVSASFWFGIPKQLVDLAVNGKIASFSSKAILDEYQKVVIRDLCESPQGSIKKAEFVESFSILVEPKVKVFVCEDLDDNKVIETAFEAKVDFIITNDKHLLKINNFRGIKIIKPKEFLEYFYKRLCRNPL
jgi:putative PIN family toxin of toxin-antitoxin system